MRGQRRRYATSKPYPRPLLKASGAIPSTPAECIYLGDDMRDVQASVAAGMEPVIAKYGYLGSVSPPNPGARDILSTGRRNCSVTSDCPFLL